MAIIEITSLDNEEIKHYSKLTERQLRHEDADGVIIVESPKVIKTALEAGYQPISLLCERKHIEGDAKEIIESLPDLKIFTGEREILQDLTGYTLTRGVLCAMKRRAAPNLKEIIDGCRKVAVIENVCDTTNIGSIFRSAAALGIGGLLFTPESCDPFNRRSIRVSMGAVFKVPWAFAANPVTLLNEAGFTTIALTLHKDSVRLQDLDLKAMGKIAVVLGTEGDGLSSHIVSQCGYKAIIPMHKDIDSLNVGAAAAVAFWQLGGLNEVQK